MNTYDLLRNSQIETELKTLPEITGIALRANEVKPGFIFAGLKGAQKDGADFVPEAIANGAVLILAEHPVSADIPVIVVPDLRRKVSLLASLIYPSDTLIKLAVTGTNGKTSTVFYVQQLLNKLGTETASIGTIGIDSASFHRAGSMTTPDAVTLNKTLHELQTNGIRVVALEASSHGLDQGRLDGLSFSAGAFTNLTQDHLDYHKTMDNYLAAKTTLFSRYLNKEGLAVLNADDPAFEQLKSVSLAQGERVLSYGWHGTDLQLLRQTPTPTGQEIIFRAFDHEYRTNLSIFGSFQVMNLFAALGLCLGAGVKIDDLIPLLPDLKAPAGRMELMGTLPNGARVFVDYAHTPDAVERVLTSLKAHTKGHLVCLMGCGGNRDTGKRPLMGAAAAKLADKVYVTDDNPRFENPADIRRAILAACPHALEYDNRETAIHAAVQGLEADDVLVLAGKGHEPGQTINGITYALDDRIEARLAILNRITPPIWTAEDLTLALSSRVAEHISAFGISIDTRTLRLGDLFIALKGEKTDGHTFVKTAVEKGASVCLVDHLIEGIPQDKQIVVSDTMDALETLAQYRRMRCSATLIGVTGSSGKTTTKEMIKICLAAQGKTHATAGNFNNQIGVPLTLATMPTDTRFAVIEMGMNHAGELMRLSNMVRPDVTIITSIGSAHREFFPTEQDVATAKSEIFDYQNRQGTAVLNRNDSFYTFLKTAAQNQGIQHIISFGESGYSDFVLNQATPDLGGTMVSFTADQKTYAYHLAFIGDHFVLDSLGALAVVKAVGGDLAQAVQTIEAVQPAAGRGISFGVTLDNKHITIIDDCYNANPSSMRASLNSLGLRRGGRKIAVLGDMLELGDLGPDMHAGLADLILKAGIDTVHTVGPLMQHLWQALPTDKRGLSVLKVADLIPALYTHLQDGDIVLIKASHGMNLSTLISNLKGK